MNFDHHLELMREREKNFHIHAKDLEKIFLESNPEVNEEKEKTLKEFQAYIKDLARKYRGFWCTDYTLQELFITVDDLMKLGFNVVKTKKSVVGARYDTITVDCYEVRWVLGRPHDYYGALTALVELKTADLPSRAM